MASNTDNNYVTGFVPFGSPIVSSWFDCQYFILLFALVFLHNIFVMLSIFSARAVSLTC